MKFCNLRYKPYRQLLVCVAVLGLCETSFGSSCEIYANDLSRVEQSGKTGKDLLIELESFSAAQSCGKYNFLVGRGQSDLNEWRRAIKSYKLSLTPDAPETYGRLAEAAFNYSKSQTKHKVRNRFMSEASANANLANGLYKQHHKKTPSWLVDVMLEIGNNTRVADANYYAQALATSSSVVSGMKSMGYTQPKGGYKGAGVVPGIDVQILFELNRDNLTSEGARQLEELGGALVGYLSTTPSASFTVVGHTDIQGDTAYNQNLSTRRAATVARALRAMMPRTVAVKEEGRGESEPKLDIDQSQPSNSRRNQLIHQSNRRVEVLGSW